MFAAFAGHARRVRIAFVIATSLVVLALAACGAATEAQGPPTVKTPSDIVAVMDTPRLTSLSAAGEVVMAQGQASEDPGDELRTYWFTTVGALAHVQEFGGSSIVRKVLHGTTELEEFSGEESLGTLRKPATFLSEEELKTHVLRWADTAGVVVEELNYVPFLGGTAELVLRPKDEREFMKNVDLTMYRLFSGLPQDEERPFLVTFVDSSGANRRVEGGFSLGDDKHIRLSDGTRAIVGGSEGFGWQADDLSEKLGVDVSGRSIEPARPVENIPEPSIADLSSLYEELCRGLGIERAAESFKSARTAAAAAAVAEVEPEGPRRDAIYEGCLRGLSG